MTAPDPAVAKAAQILGALVDALDSEGDAELAADLHALAVSLLHGPGSYAQGIAAALLAAARHEIAPDEPLAEWCCPSCGATTRARMADSAPPRPRVWLPGDTVPAGVWASVGDAPFRVHLDVVTEVPAVEILTPDADDHAAAVADERARRAAPEPDGAGP